MIDSVVCDASRVAITIEVAYSLGLIILLLLMSDVVAINEVRSRKDVIPNSVIYLETHHARTDGEVIHHPSAVRPK